ncbi:oxygen-independent coproporphyrinogen III oxidase [Loktanella sp. S4079]|uniref:oxygen-independent coproporphyrinogen III oxidase n=1 Tax=Loktanella sp. S4079 TaxID=579483 RepID=UPI0005F9F3C6|nr:oxygen-independent coproporphyrinogen III oxidase [Loktanella sp. S4079]KJZ20065.1 coproporphyrinogen III oxidase [Loktanella sp. S4079]
MTNIARLRQHGLFTARAPRYTSYPPATEFTAQIGADFQRNCLQSLAHDQPVSVYVHIPFCERLCWFCACRTQGTRTLDPVATYLRYIKQELQRVGEALPKGIKMARLHWGGGTPTILSPAMIATLAKDIFQTFTPTDHFQFSVEIDPTLVNVEKIATLAEFGMNRASIGIQDFAPKVQSAIGRNQSFATTRDCIDKLRAAGINSVNADLVYGLPYQGQAELAQTVSLVDDLKPDRIALYGYAHVPQIAKRQHLIPENSLPDPVARFNLAQFAAHELTARGYRSIGIDHFAMPNDALSKASDEGLLHRNFQGYTDEPCETLIGLGASSISQFKEGYVQNAPATAAYTQRIANGDFAGMRGFALTHDDRLRARAINQLMCRFEIDDKEFDANGQNSLCPIHAAVLRDFAGLVRYENGILKIVPEGRPLTRLIAQYYDAYAKGCDQFSQVS